MKSMMGGASILAITLALCTTPALAQAVDITDVSGVTILGILPSDSTVVPGAFDIITRSEIDARPPFSIREVLGGIPGINIVGEDAAGLALNIGVRGLDPRRSARVLLMEDGAPLFLAPYGDPAAHYSTPFERVERIEVVRGSGQVLYGPQTVGGMINFITTAVPKNGLSGRAQLAAGNNDFRQGHLNIGYGSEKAGVMADLVHRAGDGIRDHHNFRITDLAVKGRLQLSSTQELEAKVSYFKERSRITETMLSELEYRDDPFQAPTGRLDRFQQERKAAQLKHIWTPSDGVKLTTNAYYTDTFRASFRQTDKPGGYDDGADERGITTGYTTLDRCYDEDDPAPGTGGSADNAITQAASEACGGRWRPRAFEYYGLESRMDFSHALFGVRNESVLGLRFHREDIQRNQYRSADPRIQDLDFADTYAGYNEDDPRDKAGFGSEHRESARLDVRALSAYAQNTFLFDQWSLTAGVRLEDIRNHTIIDRSGSEPNGSSLKYSEFLVLPGLGVTYTGIENTTIFAGMHRGFAPPRPSRDVGTYDDPSQVAPEESTNWEVGLRYTPGAGVSLATALFFTDFDQIVISSAAGRFVNGGKSQQAGLEASGRIDFGTMKGDSHNPYLLASYTHLARAEFRSTSDAAFSAGDGGIVGADCEDDDGCYNGNGIIAGTRLPYAPRHLLALSAGYEHPVGLDFRVGIDYRSSQLPDPFARVLDATPNATGCSDAACSGLAGKIPGVVLVNASINFEPRGSRTSYFVSSYNLTDKTYIASRVDGIAAGRPRTVLAGVRLKF
jgi:Fe(3+) dicitrate transport protein